MRKWFWLAVVSGDRLRWHRWFAPLLIVVFLGLLAAGMIYAFAVFHAVSERSNTPHVSTHRTH